MPLRRRSSLVSGSNGVNQGRYQNGNHQFSDRVRYPMRGGGLSFAVDDDDFSNVAPSSSLRLAPSNPTQLVRRRQEASSIFSTPHNTEFYSRQPYLILDHSHHEIRLLRIHPKRVYVSDLPQLFPQWNCHGTDAHKLMRRPKVRNPEHVGAPYSSARYRDYYCGSKPIVPDGWAAVKDRNRGGMLEGSHRICSFADRLSHHSRSEPGMVLCEPIYCQVAVESA
jgi:hypothetical protein